MRRATGLIGLTILVAACQSPTDGGPTSVVLLGQWTYAATQTAPITASLNGVLTVSQQNGRDFQGSLDVTQQDALGNLTHLSGVVSGQVVDTAGIQFSVILGTSGRQHLGSIVRDTVRGAWVEQTLGGVTSSGSFTAAPKAGT